MHGFVVAAPTHAVDSMYNMDALFTWRQFRTRATDISTTLNILQKSPDLAPMADMNRVGVIGYGAGGLAALLTGGLPAGAFYDTPPAWAAEHLVNLEENGLFYNFSTDLESASPIHRGQFCQLLVNLV